MNDLETQSLSLNLSNLAGDIHMGKNTFPFLLQASEFAGIKSKGNSPERNYWLKN